MNHTIKDIAAKAGVSIMTVSRVINNSGYVSSKTRLKVEAAISELNYRPNLMARSLINKKSGFISVIVPDIANPFYAELTRGVEEIAIKAGYDLIISSAHRDEKIETRQIEASRGRMADGVILVLPSLPESEILAIQKSIPLVVVDKYIRSAEINKIYLNQELGAYRAVQYLLEQGHRRIAFLSGAPEIYNSNARKSGYIHALQDNDIHVEEEIILEGDFSFECGEKAFTRYMDWDEKPTAFFFASDLMALGFMRSAYQNKVKIPDDISIMGFDDITISSITNPALTTVSHPYLKMGNAAMQLLLNRLDSPGSLPPKQLLKNKLIIRETVGKIV